MIVRELERALSWVPDDLEVMVDLASYKLVPAAQHLVPVEDVHVGGMDGKNYLVVSLKEAEDGD